MQNRMPIRRGPPRPLARVVAVACLVGLAAPAAAQAHSRSTVVAIDYRITIRSTPACVQAHVLDGDRKLELKVGRGQKVVVLGYAGEPFLRFSPRGVEVNDRSPTAWSNRIASGSLPAFGAQASPRWRLAGHGRSFSWHEHRLVPPLAEGRTAEWTILLLVDGHRAAIAGTAPKVARPSFWPWLVVGGAFLLGGVALLRRGGPTAARVAAVALAWAAGALVMVGRWDPAFEVRPPHGQPFDVLLVDKARG